MNTTIKSLAIVFESKLIATSCKKDAPTTEPTVYYEQQDQVGRPAINTVFNVSADNNSVNQTTPVNMKATFQAKFQSGLIALNWYIEQMRRSKQHLPLQLC